MYYEEDYQYYEPTLANEIIMEYQQKMQDVLLDGVKNEIDRIKDENVRLKKENEECKKRENQIASKERDLKHKEDNLKREVTNEFYQSNIGETLKQYIEDCEVWFAGTENYQEQKCGFCNEERELIAEFASGETTKTNCSCAKILNKYVPAIGTISVIKFSKNNSRYNSERKFHLTRMYSPPSDRRKHYDYDFQEFGIYHIFDAFNENVIELDENKKYSEKLGFRSEEECQKYCDWLNEKNSKKATIVKKRT